jgi:hypothetical protein
MLGDTVITTIAVKTKIVAWGFKYKNYIGNLMLFSGGGMFLFCTSTSILRRHLWIIGNNNSATFEHESIETVLGSVRVNIIL